MKMRLCNAGGLLVFKRRRQMERIDLFVRVMSLKETGPLLFPEDLSKEGSDSRHTRRLMTHLGWTPGTHRLEGKKKKKTDFSKLSLDLHMCIQRQRHTASPCGINRCIRKKKKNARPQFIPFMKARPFPERCWQILFWFLCLKNGLFPCYLKGHSHSKGRNCHWPSRASDPACFAWPPLLSGDI